jgi:hypothetical protein
MPSVGTSVWLRIFAWALLGLALLLLGRSLWRRGKAIGFWRGGCLVRLAALAALAAGLSLSGAKIVGIVVAKRAEKGLRESVAEYGASSRVVERYVATYSALVEAPLFVAFRKRHAPLGGGAPEPEAAALTMLAELGTARLDTASLRHRAELAHQLARLSPEACRGLWTNQLEPARRLVSLDVLSDAELDAWFGLEARAAKLELARTVPTQSVSHERLEQAVAALLEKLPASEAGWLRQAWRSGSEGDANHGCLAYLTIADNRYRARSEDYAVLTRYLAAPSSIVRASHTQK